MRTALFAGLRQPLGKATVTRNDSGESIIRIAESVRERDVNIINTSCVPTTPIGEPNTPDSSLMELLIIIHPCRVASARRITALTSYGTVSGLAPHLHAAPEKHDIAVVSADYRLAPQARMPSILSDIPDALHFLQSSKFEPSTGGKLDTSRIAVSGCSVGGWLALLVGTRHDFEACGVKAPPLDSIRGIAAIYTNTITSLTDDLWFKNQHPVSFAPEGKMAWSDDLEGALDPEGSVLAFSSPDTPRSKLQVLLVHGPRGSVATASPRRYPGQGRFSRNRRRNSSRHHQVYIVCIPHTDPDLSSGR
ncbi:hypothetical protein CF326_g9613 [Tilletia indica]|nr:hypothetical protein CF326_g9613 [Tilletia indica]